MKNENLRMCLVCRQMQPKKQMVRVVKNNENKIFIDTTKKANGRGAYICLNDNCIALFKKQKSLNRAFKCEVSNEVYNKLSEELLVAKSNFK